MHRFIGSLIAISFIISFQASAQVTPTYAASSYQGTKFASYPDEFKNIVQMILRAPEIQELLSRVNRQGSVKIKVLKDRRDPFCGYWDSQERSIVIDGKSCRDPGKIINTIIFELHNAEANSRFDALNDMATRGIINKDQFVRETEKIEHDNLLKASALVAQGIRNHQLPQSAAMPVIYDFEKHYQVQQLTGHSEHLSWCYDRFNPNKRDRFIGTIHGVEGMTEQQKAQMLNQIVNDHVRYPS